MPNALAHLRLLLLSIWHRNLKIQTTKLWVKTYNYNAELARNPIWRHSIDASRAIDRASGPPYEGVVVFLFFIAVFGT